MSLLLAWGLALSVQAGAMPAPPTPAAMPPLSSVRLLDGPFADAVKANRAYLLALEPDRLLAPYPRSGIGAKSETLRQLGKQGPGRSHGRPLSLGAGHHGCLRRGYARRRVASPAGLHGRRTGPLPESFRRWLSWRRSWQSRALESRGRRTGRGGEPQMGAVV